MPSGMLGRHGPVCLLQEAASSACSRCNTFPVTIAPAQHACLCLPACVSTNACVYQCMCLPIYVSANACVYQCMCLLVHVSTNACVYQCTCLLMYVSTNAFVYQCLHIGSSAIVLLQEASISACMQHIFLSCLLHHHSLCANQEMMCTILQPDVLNSAP